MYAVRVKNALPEHLSDFPENLRQGKASIHNGGADCHLIAKEHLAKQPVFTGHEPGGKHKQRSKKPPCRLSFLRSLPAFGRSFPAFPFSQVCLSAKEPQNRKRKIPQNKNAVVGKVRYKRVCK